MALRRARSESYSLRQYLLGPNTVLIGAALVAITFASNWEVTPEQAKRREELVISSLVLSGLTVLGFLCAGL